MTIIQSNAIDYLNTGGTYFAPDGTTGSIYPWQKWQPYESRQTTMWGNDDTTALGYYAPVSDWGASIDYATITEVTVTYIAIMDFTNPASAIKRMNRQIYYTMTLNAAGDSSVLCGQTSVVAYTTDSTNFATSKFAIAISTDPNYVGYIDYKFLPAGGATSNTVYFASIFTRVV